MVRLYNESYLDTWGSQLAKIRLIKQSAVYSAMGIPDKMSQTCAGSSAMGIPDKMSQTCAG